MFAQILVVVGVCERRAGVSVVVSPTVDHNHCRDILVLHHTLGPPREIEANTGAGQRHNIMLSVNNAVTGNTYPRIWSTKISG